VVADGCKNNGIANGTSKREPPGEVAGNESEIVQGLVEAEVTRQVGISI